MPYDERLAERVRALLKGRHGVAEKKMFGGLTFLVNGNMSCGISGAELMVRVGPDEHEKALGRTHARPMDITGRTLKGMVFVGQRGIRTATQLRGWLDQGVAFARSLPAK